MDRHIEVIHPKGNREVVPLWKLPQLVAEACEAKKGEIAAIKAKQEEDQKRQAEAARAAQDAAIAEAGHINAPMDLTKSVEF